MIGTGNPLRVFIVAGEHSGDQLAGKLIPEIRRLAQTEVMFSGVGAEMMEEQGCKSLFPLSDIAVMGPLAILARLPQLVRRVYQTVNACVAFRPDVLVIVDSPEFTHPVAKRVKRRIPDLPVIDYVSPTVWAWRPGRARKMRAYVDHVLALLPFEPLVHKNLGGPSCTYVGHPLVERQEWATSLDSRELASRLGLSGEKPVLLMLPGSRSNEVQKLLDVFGRSLPPLVAKTGPVDVIIPTVSSVRETITKGTGAWSISPHLVEGEEDKYRAFQLADAALAASGTVTLELALAGVPMVVAYRTEWVATHLRHFISAPFIALPNLILDDNLWNQDQQIGALDSNRHLSLENSTFPELIQQNCTPEKVADAVAALINGGELKQRQIAAIQKVGKRMRIKSGTPSGGAAKIVLEHARR